MKKHLEYRDPAKLTPELALQFLKEGNQRFVSNLSKNRDNLEVINETADGQWPYAAILSCMDSRTAAELIFDQGLGDVFSIRIAGNISNEHILGSLEYAVAAAGSKLILVLGHTSCGAVKGACDSVKLGNLTGLLEEIRPSVDEENTVSGDRSGKNLEFVNKVAALNVKNTMKNILQNSPVIRELVEKGTVGIASGMYDVATGKVTFYEEDAIMLLQGELASQSKQ